MNTSNTLRILSLCLFLASSAFACDQTNTETEQATSEELGLCVNDDDLAGLSQTYGDENKTVDDVLESCVFGCLYSPERGPCVTDCLVAGTEDNVSRDCASCYTDGVLCLITNCLNECASDPDSAECVACMCGDNPEGLNCVTVTDECSGLDVGGCS